MAATPLYKSLLRDGEKLYVFPGASEDLSQAGYNDNLKLRFSKAIALNIPAENLDEGVWDSQSKLYVPGEKTSWLTQSYADRLIDGLRSYVANAEQVIRETKDADGKYTYDPTAIRTLSERLFWKWLHRNNVLQIEIADPTSDYDTTLPDLQNPSGNTSIDYMPQRLWRERLVQPIALLDNGGVILVEGLNPETIEVPCVDCPPVSSGGTSNNTTTVDVFTELLIQITTVDDCNLRTGDWILISGVPNLIVPNYFQIVQKVSRTIFIVKVPRSSTIANGTTIELSAESWTEILPGVPRQVLLKYNPVISLVTEIQSVNPVQVGSRSWTEITTYIPSSVGQTPLVLFKTVCDLNYQPNQSFPNTSQQQEEILGAESPLSPININPTDFPGSKWGIFDKNLSDTIGDGTSGGYVYLTSSGDKNRRTGDYYGVYALRNTDTNPDLFDDSKIDGLTVDFNLDHYVDAKYDVNNPSERKIQTWQDFNSVPFRGTLPANTEYNAILWYYDIEYNDGVSVKKATNLYGFSILGHPDDNPKTSETGLRIPTIKKIVGRGELAGNSKVHTILHHLSLADPIPVIVRDDIPVNNAFGFELFSNAMNTMANLNEQFKLTLSEFNKLSGVVDKLASTQWTQPQLDFVNTRVSNVESLLNLYSTMQLADSETVAQQTIQSGNNTFTQLQATISDYSQVYQILSNKCFLLSGATSVIVPQTILLPNGRSIYVRFINNDDAVSTPRPSNQPLVLNFTGNWRTGQTVRLVIENSQNARFNRKLSLAFVNGTTTINILSALEMPISTTPAGSKGYLQKFGIMPPKDVLSIGTPTLSGSIYIRNILNSPGLDLGLVDGDQIILTNLLRAGLPLKWKSYTVKGNSTVGSFNIIEPDGATALPLVSSGSTNVQVIEKVIVDITRVENKNVTSDWISTIKYE